MNQMRTEFSVRGAWAPNALIDVLTVVPVFLPFALARQVVEKPWTSLAYLRVYRALLATERVVSLGVLEKLVSDFSQALLVMALRLLALVVLMGSTCNCF